MCTDGGKEVNFVVNFHLAKVLFFAFLPLNSWNMYWLPILLLVAGNPSPLKELEEKKAASQQKKKGWEGEKRGKQKVRVRYSPSSPGPICWPHVGKVVCVCGVRELRAPLPLPKRSLTCRNAVNSNFFDPITSCPITPHPHPVGIAYPPWGMARCPCVIPAVFLCPSRGQRRRRRRLLLCLAIIFLSFFPFPPPPPVFLPSSLVVIKRR